MSKSILLSIRVYLCWKRSKRAPVLHVHTAVCTVSHLTLLAIDLRVLPTKPLTSLPLLDVVICLLNSAFRLFNPRRDLTLRVSYQYQWMEWRAALVVLMSSLGFHCYKTNEHCLVCYFLENYHIASAMEVLLDPECSILENVTREEFRQVRKRKFYGA